MLNIFNFEQQASRRLQAFLEETALAANLNPQQARLVINTRQENTIGIHLYEDQRYVRAITLESIVHFFGKTYEPQQEQQAYQYFCTKANEHHQAPGHLNILLCTGKDGLGAHLYAGSAYVQKLSVLDVLGHFNPQN